MLKVLKWFGVFIGVIIASVNLLDSKIADKVCLAVFYLCIVGYIADRIISSRINARKAYEAAVKDVQRLKRRYEQWKAEVARCGLQVYSPLVRMQEGEVTYAIFPDAELYEVRVTGTTGDVVGVAYDVGGGLSVGGGSTESSSVRSVDLIATGEFCITNKRLVFVADEGTRNISLADIIRDSGKEDFYDVWTAKHGRSQFVGVNGWICRDMVELISRQSRNFGKRV